MFCRLIAVSLLTALLPAQQPDRPAEKAPPAATDAATELRLHVIGASLSGGFRDGPITGATEQGDTVPMQQLLKAWVGDHARVTAHPQLEMLAMFTGPERLGKAQISAATKRPTHATIAIDFPFWFAYGYVEGDEAEARKKRFEKGLELLAQLQGPVLIGDLPDMTGAARRMLSPAQIPSPAVLQQLNARLAEFVKEHANLRLMPLAELTTVMKQKGVELPLAKGPLQTPPGALLQGDQLHPNRVGMAFLGLQLQPMLQQLFAEDHPLRQQTWTFEQFVAACGAEDAIDGLRKEPAPKAKDAAKPVEAGGK